MNFSDPVTAILFGDGAGAVVLSRRDEPGLGGVGVNCVLGSNYVPDNIMMDNNNSPPRHRMVTMNGGQGPRELIERQFVKMEGGPRVLRAAVNAMSEATVKSLGFTIKDLKSGNDDRQRFFQSHLIEGPHQVVVTTSATTCFPRSRAALAIPSRSCRVPVEVSLWVTKRSPASRPSSSRNAPTSLAVNALPQDLVSSTTPSP